MSRAAALRLEVLLRTMHDSGPVHLRAHSTGSVSIVVDKPMNHHVSLRFEAASLDEAIDLVREDAPRVMRVPMPPPAPPRDSDRDELLIRKMRDTLQTVAMHLRRGDHVNAPTGGAATGQMIDACERVLRMLPPEDMR
jgi:hypothetical protein